MIALDIETTGLSERDHCMISLGATQINSDNAFYGECRIYEDAKISDVALSINGFKEDEIKDKSKKLPHELYNNFRKWYLKVKTKEIELLAGQNLPSFDIRFLKHYHYNVIGNKSKWPFGHRYIDLHTYVFAKTGKSQSHDKTLKMLGMPEEPQPHDALTGAKVVAEIYRSL